MATNLLQKLGLPEATEAPKPEEPTIQENVVETEEAKVDTRPPTPEKVPEV